MSWQNDFAWQAGFIPAIKRIVGPLLLAEAPLDLDQKEATDLLILRARDMRIACRMRRMGFMERYPHDFTIRYHRASEAETEFAKLRAGFADWMFYGHESPYRECDVARWLLIDMDVWRARHLSDVDTMRKIVVLKDNGDGTKFLVYDWRKFSGHPPILVAQSAWRE
jgi:hypothetical protein